MLWLRQITNFLTPLFTKTECKPTSFSINRQKTHNQFVLIFLSDSHLLCEHFFIIQVAIECIPTDPCVSTGFSHGCIVLYCVCQLNDDFVIDFWWSSNSLMSGHKTPFVFVLILTLIIQTKLSSTSVQEAVQHAPLSRQRVFPFIFRYS